MQSSSSLVGQPSAPTTVTVSVTNTGNTINFTAPSPQPPPLIQTLPVRSTQSSPSSYYVGQPFRLMFLNPRISHCQGCRGQILQGYTCPRDLVLQHKEHVLFLNPNTGNWQLSHDLCNTYVTGFMKTDHFAKNTKIELFIVSAARSLTCRDDLDSKWRLLLAKNELSCVSLLSSISIGN